MAPVYLQSLLSIRHSVHNTRSIKAKDMLVPKTNLVAYGDQAFASIAPRLWNDLPVGLRDTKSIEAFKKSLKTYLF